MNFSPENIHKIHVIGIGGFGMSAIARILHERGFTVTGSDQALTPLAEVLQHTGIPIFIGHHADNIADADLVLASSAIPNDNIELTTAHQKDIPVLFRRDAIGFITAGYRTLAIAGTHGKTTTTALLTHILQHAELDPTYIVGGVLKNTGKNAAVGTSDLFVIEADEYQGMFLGLSPTYGVITNLEYDHPDVFPSFEAMIETFEQFVERIQDGTLIAGIDDVATARLAAKRLAEGRKVITYGLKNAHAQWQARDLQATPEHGVTFALYYQDQHLGNLYLSLVGRHNVQNALAAIAIARELNIALESIAGALASFESTGRRSEVLGHQQGVMVISDYAHHPSAIRVMLEAWKMNPEVKRLWAVWQPHTYNRLRALFDDFIRAFADADQVLVTDVYSVREQITEGLTAADLAPRIQEASHVIARYSGNLETTAILLSQEVQAGDAVLIMSAGDAPTIGELLLNHLGNNHDLRTP